jgi:hypothetical protein
MLFGVFAFLIFAGVFTLSTKYEVKTMLHDRTLETTETQAVLINPEDMIFRALKVVPLDNFVLEVKILN